MDFLRIHLFGSPRIKKNNDSVTFQRRKTLALLAYLVVTQQNHSRETLATLFWPEYEPVNARANLRRDLSRLREALGESVLLINRTEVGLNVQASLWIDKDVFTTRLTAVRQHNHPPHHLCPECLKALIEATTLYSGDFMAGFNLPDSPEFDRWQFFQTESLRHLLAEALQQLVGWYSGQGDFEPAVGYARRWLVLDPLHEPAQRQLMRLYAWSGQHAAALRQYHECVNLLQAELNISPEAETKALFEAIRTRQLPPPSQLDKRVEPVPVAAATPQGRYESQELLAVGGHGELYRGHDRVTGQTIVIKRVRPELLSGHPEYVARFRREGQLLSELNHPNIVSMLAFYEQDGQHHIVMEYVPGGSLRHLLERQPHLPLQQALTIALELADALSRAHHLNIIHRDIKPENVLLAHDGSPRLTDFGLARLRRDDSLLTQSTPFLGSPAYMSPEAIQGEEVDARSDIWSFGVLLYEMLAGQRPFTGEQITPVMVRILRDPITDIRHFRPDVPGAFAELLRRMLVKEQSERIGSMRLVAAALEAIREGHTITPNNTILSAVGSEVETISDSISPLQSVITPSPKQQIRYSMSADGVRIAYALVGEGPVFVKAANWLSHLEFDWESPVWRHWLTALSTHHTLVRYDERGCGLSDWQVDELSVEAFVRDLEGVVDTLGLERFPLLGISQGGPVALSYAVRHPEKVSHLILYGTYGAGRFNRTYSPEQKEQAQAILQLIKLGWGKDNPAFRQFFTTLFMPEATAEQMHWFNDLQHHSTSPEMAYRLEESFFHIDVGHLLSQVTTPTLILHAREDAVVPYAEGRQLATLIPEARFVTLESKNHILLENEPAWSRFLEEINHFLAEDRGIDIAGSRRGRVSSPRHSTPSSRDEHVFTPGVHQTPTPLPGKPTLHNLPPQPTAFVGRVKELSDIRYELLDDPACRLITIVGPGGIGKTRLALAAAQSALDVFPEGVFFVPLAPLITAEQILIALRENLHLQSMSTIEPKQQLLAYLHHKQILLVLDNFEHILDGAGLVADILQAAPAVKILATSRERLHLSAENVYNLVGLAYPEGKTASNDWDEAQLATYDALNLLQQRAYALQVNFPLSSEERTAMVRICHLVEGMPLALMLATSWLPLLSFSEIATEIEQCLDFLEGEMRDLPERQRSMRATIDGSWRRLAPEEKQVFMKLSVFRGGFTRSAAQAITGTNLWTMRTLADKSLLALSRRGRGTQSERYEIHELLRQYGDEALEKAGMAEVTRQGHSNYYLERLAAREVDLKGHHQLDALREIAADRENIGLAWRWALDHQQLGPLNQAMEALHCFFDLRARQAEGSELFAKAYQQLHNSGLEKTHPILGRLLVRANFLGMFAATYDHPQMEAALAESLAIARQHGHQAEIAYCLGALGSYYNLVVIDPARALPLLQESLAHFRTVGDGFFLARALQWLSLCYLQSGDMSGFYHFTLESVAQARQCGNKVDIVYSLANLVEAAILQGEYETAENSLPDAELSANEMELHAPIAYLGMLRSLLYCLAGDLNAAQPLIEKAYHLATDINYAIAMAFTAGMYALVQSLRGDEMTARQLARESLAVTGNHGLGVILANWALAIVACNQQAIEEARLYTRAALEIAFTGHYVAAMVWLLPVAAACLAATAQNERALAILSLAHHHPLNRTGWLSHWPLLAQLRQRLQTEVDKSTWLQGSTLSLETTVQQLLESEL